MGNIQRAFQLARVLCFQNIQIFALLFGLGLFMLLTSFMVFAEAGKQNATSLSGFVGIQIAFSAVQTALVVLVFALASSF